MVRRGRRDRRSIRPDHGHLDFMTFASHDLIDHKQSLALVDSDVVTLTAATNQSVPANGYATCLDITSDGAELIGGALYGEAPGHRITVDGTVVTNPTVSAAGQTTAGSFFGVEALPWIVANTSLKVEVYNDSGSIREYGWRLFTR